MKRMFFLVTVAALAACGHSDPVPNDAKESSKLPESNQSSPSPTGGAPAEGTPAGNQVGASINNIPAQLWGRWGLTPGDCSSTRGDAKGLLVINAGELRFYESRAVPAGNVQTSTDSVSGDFAFTGEGQEWTRHEIFELQQGKLIRTERDPVASFSYVRC